jgi:hypothetical protein
MSLLQMAALGAAEKSAGGIAARTRLKAKQAFEEYMRKRKKEDAAELEETRFGNNLKVEETSHANATQRQEVGFGHTEKMEDTRNKNNLGLEEIRNQNGLSQQDALLKKQQTAIDNNKQENMVQDLWLDDAGNLSDAGKGVPTFQRKADGTLIDLRPKTEKGSKDQQVQYFQMLLDNKYKEIEKLRADMGGENAELINQVGQEIQVYEQHIDSILGVKHPTPFDPEAAISKLMKKDGVDRNQAIRTLSTHPKIGSLFAELAAELPPEEVAEEAPSAGAPARTEEEQRMIDHYAGKGAINGQKATIGNWLFK